MSDNEIERLDGEFKARYDVCGKKGTVREFSHRPFKNKIGYVRDKLYVCKGCLQLSTLGHIAIGMAIGIFVSGLVHSRKANKKSK